MNFVVVTLVGILCLFNFGNALECYKCKECGLDTSKYEKETCKDDQKCSTMKTTMWIIGDRMETMTRACAASDLCDKLTAAAEDEAKTIGPDVEDYEPPEYECSFCTEDLCNDAGHGPKLIKNILS